jgi:hypothetical protein
MGRVRRCFKRSFDPFRKTLLAFFADVQPHFYIHTVRPLVVPRPAFQEPPVMRFPKAFAWMGVRFDGQRHFNLRVVAIGRNVHRAAHKAQNAARPAHAVVMRVLVNNLLLLAGLQTFFPMISLAS